MLTTIQRLQFEDVSAANRLLQQFFNEHLPVPVAQVNLRPLAVSLNSINGLLRLADGKEYFFKAHVEPSAAEREYYNSDLLERAGYPILKPVLRTSGTLTEHVLLYDIVTLPTLFEAMRTADTGAPGADKDLLREVHARLDDQLYRIYTRTLHTAESAEHARSPVHQLFYERLAGGRLNAFYSQAQVPLPGLTLGFKDLCGLKWVVNGVSYPDSLGAIIDRALATLNPSRMEDPAIVGHGDAHNGNLFLDEQRRAITYFDPAFAGVHSPFLDLPKPLYHNTFGQWLYFPSEVAAALNLSVRLDGGVLHVDHDYRIPDLRLEAFRSKVNRVLKPLLENLSPSGAWLDVFRSALACCPLLTMNLCDTARFPDAVRTLGFCHVVQFGNLGNHPACAVAQEFAGLVP